MRHRLCRRVLAFCWGSLLVSSLPLLAQANLEVNAGIQFSTPGARGLAMGGAFLGLADDATAAYTNPAGLTTLTRPEVSLESRHWRFSHVFTDQGRLSGKPTGLGVDTIEGLREGTSSNEVTGLSFSSVVYPRSRWRLALYRHELANFEERFKTQGAFLNAPLDRLFPTVNSLSLDIVNLGLSGAYEINDAWSVGVGLSSYDFHLVSRTDRYNVDRSGCLEPGQTYGPPLYTNPVGSQTQNGDDHAFGFNAGFLWRIRDGWTLGGAYRQGPRFDFVAASSVTASDFNGKRERARFDTPDFFGLGLAIQPTEVTTITLDYDRVGYSNLTGRLTGIISGSAENPADELRHFRADDANEIHLGIERAVLFSSYQIFARFGAWYDPDHRIRYTGTTPGFQALFRRGQDEVHYSAGFGFSGGHLQVDGAMELSERVDTVSLSTVVRF